MATVRVVSSLVILLLHIAGTCAQCGAPQPPEASLLASSLLDQSGFTDGVGSWRNILGSECVQSTAELYLTCNTRNGMGSSLSDGPFYPIDFIQPNVVYRLTGWVRVSVATRLFIKLATTTPNDGQTFTEISRDFLNANCWTAFDRTFSYPTYTVQQTGIFFTAPFAGSIDIDLDSVTIVPQSPLAAFPPPPAPALPPPAPIGTFYTGDTKKCAATPGPVVVPSGAVNLILNPGFELGVDGWTTIERSATLSTGRISKSNLNPYMVASGRSRLYAGPAQDIDPRLVQPNKHYFFSAWVRLAKVDSQFLKVTLRASGSPVGPMYNCLGSVIARTTCWTLVSGSTSFDFAPKSLKLYFEGPSLLADIWVDSVALYQGDDAALRALQDASIQRFRKRDMILSVVGANGNPVPGVDVQVEQTKSTFIWGVEVNADIATDVAYQNYILQRKFNQIQFVDELTWSKMQPTEAGSPDYTDTDAMVAWALSNNISLRGYNIFSEDRSFVPAWVQSKSSAALIAATEARVSSLLTRYKGKFFGWDVDYDIISGGFYKNDINVQANFFQKARLFDPKAVLFMNEHGTSTNCGSANEGGNTDKYLIALARLRKLKAPVTALAMSSNFYDARYPVVPDAQSIKINVDKLATSGLPLYVTALSFDFGDDVQADHLETAMRAYFSNPSVRGISLAATSKDCSNFCITDETFIPNLAGERYDTLRALWSTSLTRVTNAAGSTAISGFHGTYKITVTKADGTQSVFSNIILAPPSTTPLRVTLKLK